MSINAVDTKVEIAFGFGPGTTPGPSDWVDVSADLYVTPTSSGVTAALGRGAVRSGITPGRMSLTLENTSGRYNPRNPSGPYFGLLENGVQIRVTTTYGGTTAPAWTGFVDSGWPQEITSRSPVVNITATDTFGIVAQGAAPKSAWHTAASSLPDPPDHWWSVGADGWLDNMDGMSARHTGGLVEMAPLVDGGDPTWGQLDADGRGVVDEVLIDIDGGNRSVLQFWFRLPSDIDFANKGVPLWSQGSTNGRGSLLVAAFQDGLWVRILGSTWGTTLGTPIYTTNLSGAGINIRDGRAHLVTVIFEAPTVAGTLCTPDLVPSVVALGQTPVSTGPRPRIFVDGTEPTAYGLVQLSGTTVPAAPALLGGSTYWWSSTTHLNSVGAIDDVMTWQSHPASADSIQATAIALTDAGRRAWAGQRMDQRMDSLVRGFGMDAHLGTLDTSGIATHQGYRTGSPLELLQNVENTEQGRIRTDRFGDIRFSKRTWAWDDARSTAVQVTFSDDPTLIAGGAQMMLEAGTSITDDPLDIVNVAAVNSTHGRQQTVENASSVAKYGRRNAVQLSNLLHPSDRQSRSLAEWLVLSQGTPRIRADQVSFRVEDNPSVLAPLAQQIEEGWLVRIRKLTTAETLDLHAHVIGVAHSWTYTGWTVTLTLDSTRTGYDFFKWGTSTWGGSSGWAF